MDANKREVTLTQRRKDPKATADGPAVAKAMAGRLQIYADRGAIGERTSRLYFVTARLSSGSNLCHRL